jgi:Flp pilus assembly protein protease CpaA
MTWRTVGAAEIPYAIAIAAGTFATLAYLQILTETGVK